MTISIVEIVDQINKERDENLTTHQPQIIGRKQKGRKKERESKGKKENKIRVKEARRKERIKKQ